MSKIATKAAGNVFYEARFQSVKFNDRLGSREGAAEELGIDRTRLARIELGSMAPYPEEVLLMSDAYNAPELKNIFCRNMCPLGYDMPELNIDELDRITVKAMSTLRKMAETKDILLDITEDGIISEDEKPALEKVIANLNEVAAIAQSLKIWVEKNIR